MKNQEINFDESAFKILASKKDAIALDKHRQNGLCLSPRATEAEIKAAEIALGTLVYHFA